MAHHAEVAVTVDKGLDLMALPMMVQIITGDGEVEDTLTFTIAVEDFPTVADGEAVQIEDVEVCEVVPIEEGVVWTEVAATVVLIEVVVAMIGVDVVVHIVVGLVMIRVGMITMREEMYVAITCLHVGVAMETNALSFTRRDRKSVV